jgi:23S rRNA pseudouridine2605 synthase
MQKTQNISRVLSKQGICSRKQAAEIVKSGRIKINGRITTDPGWQITSRDKILLDNKPLQKKTKRYIILHKPAGYVTTRNDELGRKTVYSLLGDINEWVFPVGRLDQESEGLLIFTNDTALGNKLTDPNYKVPKTYEVLVKGIVTEDDLSRIRQGMDIGRGEKTQPAKIKILSQDNSSTSILMTITEGKNREIRRLFECLEKKVIRLIRTQFGPLSLANIPKGKWKEVDNIKL